MATTSDIDPIDLLFRLSAELLSLRLLSFLLLSFLLSLTALDWDGQMLGYSHSLPFFLTGFLLKGQGTVTAPLYEGALYIYIRARRKFSLQIPTI